MSSAPRHRLATDTALHAGAEVTLEGNAAHYLTQVLRLAPGSTIALFSRTDGEWVASIAEVKKRAVLLTIKQQTRPPTAGVDFTVAFAPIKGGRLETIIEKATELGASALQPVITQRTIVDKVNLERAESIAREAAEQCERIDWPTIHAPLKLPQFLGDFPSDRVLVYGDETGSGAPISKILEKHAPASAARWTILAGPEGGFTADELAMLKRVRQAHGVSLGPRILRADTAIITLAAMTLSAWGDWHHAPRFTGATA